jgi:hypothetical protein
MRIALPRRTDLDDLGDTTSGGTPTGSGISGNEIPATPDALLEDDEEEDEDLE